MDTVAGWMGSKGKGRCSVSPFFSLLKRVYSKRNEFVPFGSKFNPFRVDIFFFFFFFFFSVRTTGSNLHIQGEREVEGRRETLPELFLPPL